MKILVINAGSSSLKYQLIDMDKEEVLAKGNCERIGMERGKFGHKTSDGRVKAVTVEMKDHTDAFKLVTQALVDVKVGVLKELSEIAAIGHRVAQGGSIFHKSVLVNEEVMKGIESLIPLAPLHNGPELEGIRACRKVFGQLPQCVVFDTSFHSTMPPRAYMYAIPFEYYEKYKIRRYGFHGTSHRYVSNHCAHLMHQPLEDIKMITCHIGNGSSISAIRDGRVIDTSMGLTPLDGFMMGTRSGSLDPSVVTFIMEKEGLTPTQMDEILNKKSGMMGISGLSSDDRDITKAEIEGNRRAILTHEMLIYQIVKTIGSYVAAMNGVDCIVFTAGLGENQAHLRYGVCRGLKYLGVKIDAELNDQTIGGREGKISTFDSQVPIWIVPTNEELVIARDTKEIVEKLLYASTEDKTVVDLEDI